MWVRAMYDARVNFVALRGQDIESRRQQKIRSGITNVLEKVKSGEIPSSVSVRMAASVLCVSALNGVVTRHAADKCRCDGSKLVANNVFEGVACIVGDGHSAGLRVTHCRCRVGRAERPGPKHPQSFRSRIVSPPPHLDKCTLCYSQPRLKIPRCETTHTAPTTHVGIGFTKTGLRHPHFHHWHLQQTPEDLQEEGGALGRCQQTSVLRTRDHRWFEKPTAWRRQAEALGRSCLQTCDCGRLLVALRSLNLTQTDQQTERSWGLHLRESGQPVQVPQPASHGQRISGTYSPLDESEHQAFSASYQPSPGEFP